MRDFVFKIIWFTVYDCSRQMNYVEKNYNIYIVTNNKLSARNICFERIKWRCPIVIFIQKYNSCVVFKVGFLILIPAIVIGSRINALVICVHFILLHI